MAFRFISVSLAVMAVAGIAGPTLAADPVRTAPAPNAISSNRDHIDQDAQSKTNPTNNGPTSSGGGRTNNAVGTITKGGTTNLGTGTITNNGTINDRH